MYFQVEDYRLIRSRHNQGWVTGLAIYHRGLEKQVTLPPGGQAGASLTIVFLLYECATSGSVR